MAERFEVLSGTARVGLREEQGIGGAGYEAHRRRKLKRIVLRGEDKTTKQTRRQNRIKDKMLAGEAGGVEGG